MAANCLGMVTDYSLEFHSVKSGLYLPVYYHNGIQTPAGHPFRLQYNSCRFFQPHSSRTISFTGIAPIDNRWSHQMRDGKFEVANRSDFSDARTLHTIGTSGLGYHTIPVKSTSSYRYIRFVSPVGERCNVSILEFYGENNEKLQGTVIGTPGANTTNTSDKVFDGDVNTFFEGASNHSWVGLNLGKPRRIAKIRYLPRIDGNAIYEGHVYELFYWNGDEWHSLGKKTADSQILLYQAPTNALFFLRNITTKKIGRYFTIQSGEQTWL